MAQTATQTVDVPFVIRGRVVEDRSVEHRSGHVVFRTPDPHALLSELPPGATAGAAAGSDRAAAPPMALRATGTDYATSVRVTLTVSPGAAGPNSFAAAVSDFDTGDPLPAERVELTGTPMAKPDLASARLKLVKGADGSWQGKGPLLSIGGHWTLVTIVEAAGGGVTVPLELDVPNTNAAHPGHDART